MRSKVELISNFLLWATIHEYIIVGLPAKTYVYIYILEKKEIYPIVRRYKNMKNNIYIMYSFIYSLVWFGLV